MGTLIDLNKTFEKWQMMLEFKETGVKEIIVQAGLTVLHNGAKMLFEGQIDLSTTSITDCQLLR